MDSRSVHCKDDKSSIKCDVCSRNRFSPYPLLDSAFANRAELTKRQNLQIMRAQITADQSEDLKIVQMISGMAKRCFLCFSQREPDAHPHSLCDKLVSRACQLCFNASVLHNEHRVQECPFKSLGNNICGRCGVFVSQSHSGLFHSFSSCNRFSFKLLWILRRSAELKAIHGATENARKLLIQEHQKLRELNGSFTGFVWEAWHRERSDMSSHAYDSRLD
jgi:hypothetical protein